MNGILTGMDPVTEDWPVSGIDGTTEMHFTVIDE
jgi:hypothetical protein